jgi:hypothetical protein
MYENTNFGAHESKQFPETTKIESTNISTFTINVYFYENESALFVQVICQNITVPNITPETYTKYNNAQ